MPWKIICSSTLLGAILVLMGACRPLDYHSQSYVFGTLVDVQIDGESPARARALANHIFQEFQSLHNRLHAWHSDSELSTINHAFQNGQSLLVADDLAQMLAHAKTLSLLSDGLFNPAMGGLLAAWGFQQDDLGVSQLPFTYVDKFLHDHPNMTDIQLQGQRVKSSNRAVRLDFGGYTKGYALDLALGYLRQQGVKNALINIGGNMIALGQHGSRPWRVGIQHPRAPLPIATLDLPSGWAIGTSGDYQRYFMLNGMRYCHIINPRTAYPVQHTQAVTVLIPPQTATGVLSDVMSKPIFIASAEAKTESANKLGVKYFLIVNAAGQVSVSRDLLPRLHWNETNAKFQIVS